MTHDQTEPNPESQFSKNFPHLAGDWLGLCRWWRDDQVSDWGRAQSRDAAPLRRAAGLRPWLEARRAEGFNAMLTLGHRELFAALGKRPSPALPRVLPVVPNLQGFMREAVEYGMVGAGMRRAMRVGPIALAGLGLRSVGRAPLILRRDFPTMLRSFVELELADFARYEPPIVFLQTQMTDLALAMRNPRIILAFAQAVRQRTGAEPGLMTANPAALAPLLAEWGIEVAAVVAPWDATGHTLRPNAAAWQQTAQQFRAPVWADMQGRLETLNNAKRGALTAAGLSGIVRDDAALWAPHEGIKR